MCVSEVERYVEVAIILGYTYYMIIRRNISIVHATFNGRFQFEMPHSAKYTYIINDISLLVI